MFCPHNRQAKGGGRYEKIYTAPKAEMIVFAPREKLAASWGENNEAPWKTGGFFWNDQGGTTPKEQTASMTTVWYDFGQDEFNK